VTSAFAGAGIITTLVEPLSANVTYSTEATVSPTRPALITYVGYRVTVASDPTNTNTINNVRFTATTTVTDPAEKATFSSADGASCLTTGADLTSIECTIGQLRAGETFPTFAIFFKTPVKITNGVADGDGEDKVKISGISYYAEGTGGLNSPPDNSTNDWPVPPAEIAVVLGTCNPDLVKSAFPKSGGFFFTGGNGPSCATDPFSVSVTVPQAPTYSTVTLDEDDVSANINCASLGNFFKCFGSAVTIPNVVFTASSGSYLTIGLRVEASNIKPGTKIGNVLIQYDDGSNIHNVGACASPTTPRSDGIPCIAKAVYYKNKSVLGWTPELDGAFAWTLLNLRNGLFNVF
jgi:hypothetical protein